VGTIQDDLAELAVDAFRVSTAGVRFLISSRFASDGYSGRNVSLFSFLKGLTIQTNVFSGGCDVQELRGSDAD